MRLLIGIGVLSFRGDGVIAVRRVRLLVGRVNGLRQGSRVLGDRVTFTRLYLQLLLIPA